ncbi:ribosomal protein L6 (chloroplast) [Skeletonema marinoi]|jgi:large subunit ribosomal protein L6|uniref:Large ribosomal subunit protein uL6c n=1 Tax=Skeletonema marinoi TaxID=267567 RepID=A0A8K1H0K5_9STRA|nr:ribosomal protein L6 [Skeletonema marinoi]KAK1732105.1 ribosomal protein L6 [Skeletonema marinoi]UAM91356.1 ribosomal protein L6 [Skeletonema marinoi]
MSRIGKLPIKIPTTVDINVTDNNVVVKGKFGTLERTIPEVIKVEQTDGTLIVGVTNETRTNKALHGLYRTLINNMLVGVSEQFLITLELQGVGYRASVQGKSLVLNLGYSHPVNIDMPDGIEVEVVQNTTLNIKACDKEQLGLFAAKVRSWRPPEPYKGKGILYKGEKILRKAGKSGK